MNVEQAILIRKRSSQLARIGAIAIGLSFMKSIFVPEFIPTLRYFGIVCSLTALVLEFVYYDFSNKRKAFEVLLATLVIIGFGIIVLITDYFFDDIPFK